MARRMLKMAVQQGRSERGGEAYASVRWVSERRENAAGGLFQHPARQNDVETGEPGRGVGWLSLSFIRPTPCSPLSALDPSVEVDNSKDEVLNNRASTEPKLFTEAVARRVKISPAGNSSK